MSSGIRSRYATLQHQLQKQHLQTHTCMTINKNEAKTPFKEETNTV